MVLQQIVTASCAKEAKETIALSTVVAATLGYPEGVKVAKYAQEHNLAVADAVLEMGIMTKEEADSFWIRHFWLTPRKWLKSSLDGREKSKNSKKRNPS